MTTHLIILLDRSSSMYETAPLTLQMLNEAQEQYKQTLPPGSHYTLATFSSQKDPLLTFVFSHQLLSTVPQIQPDQYQPEGCTALYDALFKLIAEFENGNEKTILLIITDGQENDSRHHTRQEIFDKINKLRVERGWEFVFMGANQDAYESGSQLGIPYNIDYQQDASMPQLMRSVSHAISSASHGDHTPLLRMSSRPHKVLRQDSANLDPPQLKRSYSYQ